VEAYRLWCYKVIYLIIDTSFLLEMVSLGKDLITIAESILGTPLKPVLLSGVKMELKDLFKRSGVKGMKVRAALELSENFELFDEPLYKDESVDEYIVRVARKMGWAVATNDKKLRKKLRIFGVPHIYLRSDGGVGVYGELEN